MLTLALGCDWIRIDFERDRSSGQASEGSPPGSDRNSHGVAGALELEVRATEVRLNGAFVAKPSEGTATQPRPIAPLQALLLARATDWKQSHPTSPPEPPRLSIDATAPMSDVASVALTIRQAGCLAVRLRLGHQERIVRLGEPRDGAQPRGEKTLYLAPLDSCYHLAWKDGSEVIATESVAKPPAGSRAKDPLPELLSERWGAWGVHRNPADLNRDAAVVLYRLDRPFSAIAPALEALLIPHRSIGSGARTEEVPAFAVWLYVPAPGRRPAPEPDPNSPVIGRPLDDSAPEVARVPAIKQSGQFGLAGQLNATERQSPPDAQPSSAITSLTPTSSLDAVYGVEALGLLPPRAPLTEEPPPPADVRLGVPKVKGGLPLLVIKRIVEQSQQRFRICFEHGLRRNPGLSGDVTVRFVIGRDGSVTNVQHSSASLSDQEVARCVDRVVYGLSFPEPGRGILVVKYPINFAPGRPR